MIILHLATENVQQFYNKKHAVHLVIVQFRSLSFTSLSTQKVETLNSWRERQGRLEEDNVLSSPQEKNNCFRI